jgi:branched-chain amino acid transport system ATP-binding protein
MMATVQRLWKSANMTLIFIEHDIELVFRTAEVIHVLRYGAVLASGTPDEIRGHPDVIEAYLGRETVEETA